MAKKIKKLLAVTLAVSMCMSMVSVPAFATESTDSAGTAGYVEPVEGGENQPEEGTLPLSGVGTGVGDRKNLPDENGGTGTLGDPEVEVEKEANDKGGDDIDKDWNGSDKENPSDKNEDGKTVIGEELTTSSNQVVDGVTQIGGSVAGKETTTDTNVTKTEDQVVSDSGEVDTNRPDDNENPDPETKVYEDPADTNKDGWVEGKGDGLTEDGWTPGEIDNNTKGTNNDGWEVDTTKQETNNPGTPSDAKTPTGGVKIDLTPNATENGPWTNTQYVDVEEFAALNLDADILAQLTGGTSANPKQVSKPITENGNTGTQTIKAIYGTNTAGEEVVIGYEIKRVLDSAPSETPRNATLDEIKPGSESENRTDKNMTSEMVPEKEGTEPVYATDASGNRILDDEGNPIQIGETVTSIVPSTDPKTGKTIYTVTKTTTTYTENTQTTNKGEAGFENKLPDDFEGDGPLPTDTKFTLPAEPTASTTEENGVKTVVSYVPVTNEDGTFADLASDAVIGYKVMTVKTDLSGKLLSTNSVTQYGRLVKYDKNTVYDPQKVDEITRTQATTTEIIVYSAEEATRNTELVYKRDVDIETTRVVETDTYQLVEVDDGLYFLYQGKMYPVVAIRNDSDSDFVHGKLSQTTGYVDAVEGAYELNADTDLRGNPGEADGGNYSWQDIKTGDADKGTGTSDEEFMLVGYGLYTNFLLNEQGDGTYKQDDNGDYLYQVDKDGKYKLDKDGNKIKIRIGRHEVRQYALKDSSGNIHYVLCAELDKAANQGAYYGDKNVMNGQEQLDNVYFAEAGSAVAKIQSISMNGFWGTENGMGSLDAVKDLLRRNNLGSVADSLTAGQALAATQAAIWEYGRAGTADQMDDDHIIGLEYANKDLNGDGQFDVYTHAADSADNVNVKALRDLLITLANRQNAVEVEEIDTDDITKGAIVIKEKTSSSSDGESDVYKTDISFTLAVSTSSINGDLLVHVYTGEGDNRTKKATYRLTGSGDEARLLASSNATGSETTYTISDIELAEGVKVTLNLEGTQHLANGVYIYESSSSQDFVGLSKVDRDVNLEVSMEFKVDDPQILHSDKTEYYVKNDTRTDSQSDFRTDTKTYVTGDSNTTTTYDETVQTIVYADVTVTEVTETTEAWASEWMDYYYPSGGDDDLGDDDDGDDDDDDDDDDDGFFELGDDDVPMAGMGDMAEMEDLMEDEVPLAMVPATGDMSVVWYAMSLVSGAGLAGMSVLDKKRKENEDE